MRIDRTRRLYAHRGGSARFVENSDRALEEALADPLLDVETDVRLSADGVVVLSHDPTLERAWGLPLEVARTPWRVLARVRGPRGERMMRLEELVDAAPARALNIDPKDDAVVAPLLGVLSRRRAFDHTILASFSTRRLLRIRQMQAQARTATTPLEIASLWAAAAGGPAPRVSSRACAMQIPERVWGMAVLTDRLVALAHARGIRVDVWTINDHDRAARLLARGVDGIMTDRPERIRPIFAQL